MKALRPALQDKQFSPAYYLHGEDEYLKEDALRHLVDAAADPATRDFNLDQRRGSELDGESLASLLAMPPMMAERRVVVIRDVGSLRKDARVALENHLGAPAADVLVIMTTPAGEKPDKTLEARSVSVDCAPLKSALVSKWITNRVEKTLGTGITESAVELLQSAVGEDLAQLAIELDKLVAYCGGRTIDEESVSSVVGIRRDETPGMLLDAIARRDSATALALLPGVLRQPKTTGVQLVMMLTTQTLAMAMAHARNAPPGRAADAYWGVLKSGGSPFVGRPWGEAVRGWSQAHGKWTPRDIDHALAVLLQADLSLKGSRVSIDEQILATAILQMCNGGPSPARSNAA